MTKLCGEQLIIYLQNKFNCKYNELMADVNSAKHCIIEKILFEVYELRSFTGRISFCLCGEYSISLEGKNFLHVCTDDGDIILFYKGVYGNGENHRRLY